MSTKPMNDLTPSSDPVAHTPPSGESACGCTSRRESLLAGFDDPDVETRIREGNRDPGTHRSGAHDADLLAGTDVPAP